MTGTLRRPSAFSPRIRVTSRDPKDPFVQIPRRLTAVTVVGAVALLGAACGDDASEPAATGDPATATADAADGAGEVADDISAIEVLGLPGGETTTLTATITGDRPVLLWFWAPH